MEMTVLTLKTGAHSFNLNHRPLKLTQTLFRRQVQPPDQ